MAADNSDRVHPPQQPGLSRWRAPSATGPVAAGVELPGSKSLTSRALILAALSTGPSRIRGGLRARDSALMIGALRALGVGVDDAAPDWMITPGPLHAGTVDCGLAGTVMRFVPPLAALAMGDTLFDGDPHARTRPMNTLLDGLRQVGVTVDDGGTGVMPFTVRGRGGVAGGVAEIEASSSSQFVSALLLAGARFDKGVEIHHVGPAVPSLPHIDMTVAALRSAGVAVEQLPPDRWIVRPGPITAPDVIIEPDLSNAAPFLAAALVTGGSVTVARWPSSTTQAGDALRSLLSEMGASVLLDEAGLTVRGTGSIGPLVADLHDVGELTPVLAAVAALADGESRLTGVGHIRGHETDRLAALRVELTALGAAVEELTDGLVIRPARLRPGTWRAYADHRMAHAGAVLGLAVPGVVIDDISSTTKTMADFPQLWDAMLKHSESSAG